jgi:hypothetical protein
MGGHQVALVLWEGNVSVINWFKEVESPGMSLKGMEREAVTCINTISIELESCRS